MKRYGLILFSLLLIGFLYTCRQDNYQPSHLTHVSLDKRLLSDEEDLVTSPYVVFRDSFGNELSPELREKLNQGQLYLEPYVNQQGEIEEVIVREMQPKYLLWASLERLARHRDKDYEVVKLNCAEGRKLLRIIYKRHKALRADTTSGVQLDHTILEHDRNTVLTLLEYCGFPSKKEVSREGLIAIYYALSYRNGAWLARYYPIFKEKVSKGELPAAFVARIEDRALVYNGYPQIYGTHYHYNRLENKYGPAPLRDSSTVDQRRAEVGLGTLEEQKRNYSKFEQSNFQSPPSPPRPPLFPARDSALWRNLKDSTIRIHINGNAPESRQ